MRQGVHQLTPDQDARILRAYRQMDKYGAIANLAERFRVSKSAIHHAIERAEKREAEAPTS